MIVLNDAPKVPHLDHPGKLDENIGAGHGSGAGVIDTAHADRTNDEQVGANAGSKAGAKPIDKERDATTGH